MHAPIHLLKSSAALRPLKEGKGKRLLAHWTILSMLVTPIVANPAYAEIADEPLYLASPVEPNIMFLLDDSGSMHWDVMPDHSLVYFTFPRPNTLYGTNYSGNYGSLTSTNGVYNGVARFNATNRYARYFRTAQFNPIYYNPATRYDPWRNADGSLMANAVATAAKYNPMAAEGTLNLTQNKSSTAVWINDNGSENATSLTYYPATYFKYIGPGTLTGPTDANNTQANFTLVEIKSGNAPFAKAATRTDCAGSTCTYGEEMQNFANWFSYYRSRILSARAGIGKAFAEQGTNIRVGFGAINKGSTAIDGASTRTIIRGVRTFSGADRTSFFDLLYTHPMPTAGTPLRRALGDAGNYFLRDANAGPWGNTPGTNDGAELSSHLQCRQSHTILMTDGYWGDGEASTSAAQANVDGTAGPTISGPNGKSFTYSAVSPFTDGNSNTLADVAMYYWKNDLRTDLDNEVPTSKMDPAFWQHMTTFGVGLGVTGSQDPTAAFDAISSGASITWPNPVTNPAKLDDLLHASVNGRGGFFSAGDPVTFAAQLASVLATITDRTSSSAAVAANSARMSSSTHLYQAVFKSGDWSGQLKAFPLLPDGTVGAEIWDAANGIPAHGLRNIKTWNGTGGADFSGALGNLSAAQVDYLRGDDSNEVKNGGTFRDRSSKLGDIVNADPHYVKEENFAYNLLPGAEGTSYSTFLGGKDTRTAVVYGAANDGMLHAFRASDGAELFAYVPKAIWPDLPLLTDPDYTHRYFVDGSPTAWDAYLGASWKTVLVGGLGAGGKAVYALDVSNPDTFGASSVLWEYQGNTVAQQKNMGYVLGEVTVARFPDGNYWAVFGNGYESTDGKSVLFMVRVDSPSTVKMFEVGAGPGNGMSTPILVDSNADRIVDLVYAGDLKGNVWKFEFPNNANQWKSAYGTSPLFQAKDASGNPQPITSPLEVGLAPPGASGLMVYFGTGKYFETGDNSTKTVQSMYGVVDEDGYGGGSSGNFSGANHRTQLQSQSIIFEGTVSGKSVRVISDNPVDYSTQKGWVIDLLKPPTPGTAMGERVIAAPMLFGGKLLFQTIIPSESPCDYGGGSWLMQVAPATGGELSASTFDISGDGLFNAADMIDIGGGVMKNASGLDTGTGISGGFGKPIKAGDKAYVPVAGTGTGDQDEDEDGGAGKPKAPAIASGTLKSRASWRQIQ